MSSFDLLARSDYTNVRLILGDQLNAHHSWYREKNPNVLYVIAELPQETSYVTHHQQKILAFFSAMNAFSRALSEAGHQVLYLTLDETISFSDLGQLIDKIMACSGADVFEYQQPDEYRLSQQLLNFALAAKGFAVKKYETEHFFLSQSELKEHFTFQRPQRMEFFYRKMRKRFGYLMEEERPLGGQWNYDENNRNKLKVADIETLPKPLLFDNDVTEIRQRLANHNVAFLGEAEDAICWPINRQQSLTLLEYFCEFCLAQFGRFQDAMICNGTEGGSRFSWSLFHSRLSFSLNSKMISPELVVTRVLEEFERRPEAISISQVEGFVRQILGWREFIRGVYWANMPEYSELNHLTAETNLPSWFWNGDTKMNCQRQVIKQSLQFGYAHHIQRLMVTGNFCLIAGVRPEQVDAWYLGIYVDALEWVEMPNTRGMSQFADGGLVGSKAYAASGNYINKMSNYCQQCQYDVKAKVGKMACPLNSLYWHFMLRHKAEFERNPRNTMVYRNWDKQGELVQQQVLSQAADNLINIEQL